MGGLAFFGVSDGFDAIRVHAGRRSAPAEVSREGNTR